MKIKNILYATLFAASLLFQSCSLDEDTSGISSPDNFFRKYSECQSVVNSCYIPIKSIYTYTYMLATECVTDIAYCPSGTRDASLDISPAVPRFGSTVWTQGYLGVQRCNFAVNGIERAYQNEVLSEEQYLQLLCEAKTLRAFYYWTLTCFFGNVPFYFDDVTDNEVLNRIQVLPRMDADETRATVIKDLQSIAPLVDQTRTYDNEANRLGASCAYMLIAKMAMWNKEWDTALEALQQIETIYGPLSQYDYAQNILFRNKNTPESIMEIQHTYTQGGLTYTSNVACICQPYPRSANSSIYDGVDIPELRRPYGRPCGRTSTSVRDSNPRWARISAPNTTWRGAMKTRPSTAPTPVPGAVRNSGARTCRHRPTATITRYSATPTRC